MRAIMPGVTGGMSPGNGRPIGERPVETGQGFSPASTSRPRESSAGPRWIAARDPHVWVRDDKGGPARAGLVLAQVREDSGQWWAEVVSVAPSRDGSAPSMLREWMPAEQVTAARMLPSPPPDVAGAAGPTAVGD